MVQSYRRMPSEFRQDVDGNQKDLTNLGSFDAEVLGSKVQSDRLIWAGEYDGADEDVRLDAAIAAASDGDYIYLEKGSYDDNRTIDKELTIEGTRSRTGTTSVINGDWTLDDRVAIIGVGPNGSITFNYQRSIMDMCNFVGGALTIAADRCLVTRCHFPSVTFNSGTSSGLVDSCVGASVTDNGTNSVGDNG